MRCGDETNDSQGDSMMWFVRRHLQIWVALGETSRERVAVGKYA